MSPLRNPPVMRRAVLTGGTAALIWPQRPGASEDTPDLLVFDQLYKSFGVLGYQFSDRVLALNGKTVRISGYMAPPLKAESDFFVLTRQPLAICPFCQSDADWPVDIIVITMRAASALVSAGRKIMVTGKLEVGAKTDPSTGFVSQIRVVDADFRAL